MTTPPPLVPVLSTAVTAASYPAAIDALTRLIDEARPGAPAPSIILASMHGITEAARNPAYRETMDDASLVLPDGMPLVWAMRMQGHSLSDRCYGPEFMVRVLEASERTGWRHFFYGATESTLEKLCSAVQHRWPGTAIAGSMSPPFGPLDDEVELQNIAKIRNTHPTIIWVGIGCPKQDVWMQRYRHHTEGSVVIASGAAFDFIAGVKTQAPLWMQRHGLEWLFRLIAEPRRLWKRYLFRIPYFIVQLILQLTGLRWRNPHVRP